MENIKKQNDYILNTYAKYDLAIVEGSGSVATDINGKKYIDFSSGIGVNSLGYCDIDWTQAVCEQASKLNHISNLFYSPVVMDFCEKLTRVTKYTRVFLANSGAEANECAIKTARKYSFDKYGLGRHNIITLTDSFHGRTITTVKATGQEAFHNYFFPFTEGFLYAAPNFEAVLEKMDNTICAVMLEPIQGEGGVTPLDSDFVQKLFAYCEENDILTIFDEVQTGFGRTGKVLCGEYFNVFADITTLAKGLGGGLPIGACLVGEKCSDTMGISSHGSTFGGNPICVAGANAVLDKVCTIDFLNEVCKKGEKIQNTVRGWNCPNIKDVRGFGLMIGIELENLVNKEIVQKCIDNGLIPLTAGKNVVRLLPPLNISDNDLDTGLEILKNVICGGVSVE